MFRGRRPTRIGLMLGSGAFAVASIAAAASPGPAWVPLPIAMLAGGLLALGLSRSRPARPAAEPPGAAPLGDRERLLFEAHPQPMWVYDLETLRFLDVNPAAVRSYGYTREQFLGMSLKDIRPPEDVPAVLARVADLGHQDHLSSGGWRHRLADGSLIEVEISSGALTWVGRPARLVMAIDVSRRLDQERQLRRGEARFRRLAESSLVGVAFIDASGRLLEANDAFRDVAGVPDGSSVAGISWADLVPSAGRHGSGSGEAVLRRVDGTAVPVLLDVIESPGEEEAIGLVLDLSGLRRAERERDRLLEAERAAHASARESERRYRLLSQAIPQIVWTADADGEADYFNARWADYTGLDKARSRGRGWTTVLYPEDEKRLSESWAVASASGRGLTIDLRLRRLDGEYRWHLLHLLPARDDAGRPTRWLGTFTDIDEQKRAEGALAFLAEASECLATSLDDRTILSRIAWLAVPRLADLCRVDVVDESDERLHRSVAAVAVEGDPERVSLTERKRPVGAQGAPSRDVLTTGTPAWGSRADGEAGRAGPWGSPELEGASSFICVPLRTYNRPFGTLTLLMTGSGRRYGPADLPLAELFARRAAIALENARLLAAAEQARRDSEEANRTKDRFLAVLSHELRTPLTPVLLATSALLDDPETPPRVRDVLEMTRRNIEMEARLIGDLLDVSRIGAGKLRLAVERTDAHAAIWQALETCGDDVRSAGLELEVDLAAEHHHLDADPARLQQVIWNLVKNAVKFTPAGGSLFVRTSNRAAKPDEGEGEAGGPDLVIEVQDTGIGIDPAELPRLFDAFAQGEGADGVRRGGLGLGLAIGRAVAEAHGGRLYAESGGRGRGATFILEVPSAPGPAAEPPPLPEPALPAAAPLSILLVEDNPDTLRNLAWVLEVKGHAVTTAATLAEALEIASRASLDLIISDIELPDGSGLDLMRRAGAPAGVPGIALSGYGTEDDIRESRAAGFTEHLTKPVLHTALDAAIRRTIAAHARPRHASAIATPIARPQP